MSQFTFRSAALSTALVMACNLAWSQAASTPMAPMAHKSGMPSAADKAFVNMAALGGMTEVKLGELATSNGESQGVKDFGKHMVDDHQKANDELAGIAKNEGLVPPADLDATHQQLVKKFSAMKGAAFDKAYWSQMLADHKKTIALFEKEAASGKDPEMKAFAAKTLPTLNMHLKMVQDAMSRKPSKM